MTQQKVKVKGFSVQSYSEDAQTDGRTEAISLPPPRAIAVGKMELNDVWDLSLFSREQQNVRCMNVYE